MLVLFKDQYGDRYGIDTNEVSKVLVCVPIVIGNFMLISYQYLHYELFIFYLYTMNVIAEQILAKISEATPTFEKGYVANGEHFKYRYKVIVPNDDKIALDTQVDALADKILKKRKKIIKDRTKVYFDHFSITINNNEEDSEVTVNDHYIVERIPDDGILEEDANLDIETKING